MLFDRPGTPFLGPALAGVAMIDGLPKPEAGVQFVDYGYGLYDLPGGPAPATSPAEEKERVLRKAAKLGFTRVLVLDAHEDKTPFLVEWCLGETKPIWTP